MRTTFIVLSAIVLAAHLAPVPAGAFGEGVLARTGEYTFFIKPDPTSCVTYYQKMVPCVVKETVRIPKRVVHTLPVPVPQKQRIPILLAENPVDCGKKPCVECFPRPSCKPAVKDCRVPQLVPVRVADWQVQTKCVERKVKMPQWFAVQELPRPPVRKVKPRKVHHPRG